MRELCLATQGEKFSLFGCAWVVRARTSLIKEHLWTKLELFRYQLPTTTHHLQIFIYQSQPIHYGMSTSQGEDVLSRKLADLRIGQNAETYRNMVLVDSERYAAFLEWEAEQESDNPQESGPSVGRFPVDQNDQVPNSGKQTDINLTSQTSNDKIKDSLNDLTAAYNAELLEATDGFVQHTMEHGDLMRHFAIPMQLCDYPGFTKEEVSGAFLRAFMIFITADIIGENEEMIRELELQCDRHELDTSHELLLQLKGEYLEATTDCKKYMKEQTDMVKRQKALPEVE
ncbi:hypothetical protein F53441_1291 [Fusarium austroafricanum]|uniref:Uncharacterized protein n=1 Tax=Fusarium austroafricanum TaxID=2364996 RepID=A0A8H4P467_9HYPO|nr:hypothetical protein F53441_1291 [Fusarium austroafricanum]